MTACIYEDCIGNTASGELVIDTIAADSREVRSSLIMTRGQGGGGQLGQVV